MKSCDQRSVVGCLNYLALVTRPDITHTANLLSSFYSKFCKAILECGKRVFTLPKRYKVRGNDF